MLMVLALLCAAPAVAQDHRDPAAQPDAAAGDQAAGRLAGETPPAQESTQALAKAERVPQSAELAQQQTAPVDAPTVIAAEKKQFRVSWDNQIKYTNAFRLKKRNPKLVDVSREPFNINQDDGDLNFHGGLSSNRGDLLSEIDVTNGQYGVRASMAAWGDTMYNRRLPGNPTTSAEPFDGFHFSSSAAFRDIEFHNVELLDAFLFGKVRLGKSGTMLSARAGQFAQVWGQTLFYGANGIAGGMVPVDAVKAMSVPNSQTKEIMRPVPQASVQLEFGPKVTVAGYYQFNWEATRLPGTGSYFDNGGDFLMPGGKRFIIPGQSPPLGQPYAAFYRDHDISGHNGGQFGVELLFMAPHGYDLGFYAIRYNEKTPQMNICPGCVSSIAGDTALPGYAGTYYATYQSNVSAFAVSATKTFGLTNLALEVGGRIHAGLVDDACVSTPEIYCNNTNHREHATGDSLHANLSSITIFSPNKLSKETSLTMEMAWNNLLSITSDPQRLLDTAAKKQALSIQGIYDITYRQALHGLDLTPRIGFSFSPLGKSSVTGLGVERGGNIALSLNASYLDVWRASITYNTYYGPVYPYQLVKAGGGTRFSFGQSMADRDFIAFSIYRSFGLHLNQHGSKTK